LAIARADHDGCGTAGPVAARLVVAISWLVLLLAVASQSLHAAETAIIDSLAAVVEELRYAGRYDEAVEAVRSLLHRVENDSTVAAWVREDTAGELRELERIAALPTEQRKELSRAHRLQPEIADRFARARYAEAEALAREQLEVFRRILGEVDFDTGLTLDNLAVCLDVQGDLREAETCSQQALEIYRQVLPSEHPQILQALNTIAALMHRNGDYAGAEPFFREILSVQRRHRPVDDEDTARYLYNLGGCLLEQGSFAEAQDWLQQALRVYHDQPGKEREIARCLVSLGRAHLARGEAREAQALLEESARLYERALGPAHPDVAEALFWLARTRQESTDQCDLREAERLFSRALAITRARFGEAHPSVAKILCRLGMLRATRGRLDEARSLIEEGRSAYVTSLGEEHRYVAFSLQMLATVEYTAGNLPAAEEDARRAAGIYEPARRRVGFGLDRATFQRSPYAELATVQLALGKRDAAWESVERMQGRLLVDLLVLAGRRPISTEESAREDSLESRLGRLEREVSVLREAPASDSAGSVAFRSAEMRARLLAAEAAWQAFERELALKYPAEEGAGFGLARVQAALYPDAAVIGWLDFVDLGGAYSSWGYVIRSEGPVEWARLPLNSGPSPGVRETPRERVRAWRERLASAASAPEEIRRCARELHAERIEPIARLLQGVRELIVIPSGVMVGIPLEALEDRDDKPLGERYEVSYAPSATIFAWLVEQRRAHPAPDHATQLSALLVGDPEFGEPGQPTTDEGHPEPPAIPEPSHVTLAPSRQRGDTLLTAPTTRGPSRPSLPRLPGTRVEVEGLAPLWPKARVLLGREASENALLELARTGAMARFGVLHFATHARVDNDRPEASALELSVVDPQDAGARRGEHPCDGVVTGREILREWKLNADLVTLSACDTGLGREVAGEGYVGFAQAFFQAGARSLLVSLWKVEDRSTALLMRRFYELWTGRDAGTRAKKAGMSKAAALREAKIWLRNYSDSTGTRLYVHPYYWAGFVLLGDRD
jgi:CHAT domain-containing protein